MQQKHSDVDDLQGANALDFVVAPPLDHIVPRIVEQSHKIVVKEEGGEIEEAVDVEEHLVQEVGYVERGVLNKVRNIRMYNQYLMLLRENSRRQCRTN